MLPYLISILQRLPAAVRFFIPRLQQQGKPLEPATVALRYRVTTLHSIFGWEQSQSALPRAGEGGGKAGNRLDGQETRSPNISLQTLTLGPPRGGTRVYLHR